jgi:hypothetical protein
MMIDIVSIIIIFSYFSLYLLWQYFGNSLSKVKWTTANSQALSSDETESIYFQTRLNFLWSKYLDSILFSLNGYYIAETNTSNFSDDNWNRTVVEFLTQSYHNNFYHFFINSIPSSKNIIFKQAIFPEDCYLNLQNLLDVYPRKIPSVSYESISQDMSPLKSSPTKKILFILTICNQLRMTIEALSYIVQSLDIIDLIILDDHSIDGSAAYLQKKGFHVLTTTKPTGVTHLWNLGDSTSLVIISVTGRYLFLPSDLSMIYASL